MRWRLRLNVLLGMALLCVWPSGQHSARAQPGDDPTNNLAMGSSGFADGLLGKSRAARFQVILGRLSLHPPSYIVCKRSASLETGDGTERVEVTARNGVPSLHYILESTQRRFIVEVLDAEEVAIESEIRDPDGSERMLLHQPRSGLMTVRFETQRAGGRVTIDDELRVRSLVHLRAHAPARYARHLDPLFARILPAPPAECDVRRLTLVTLDAADSLPDLHNSVRNHVDQLRSPSVVRRNEAERALTEIGLPALSLIRSLDPTDLDAEQRQRLQRVERQICPGAVDTPAQLACWLATDIQYWKLMSHHVPLAQRDSLNATLIKMVGQTLEPSVRVADATR